MVASLVGFSIAVNQMIQTSARNNNSTDTQTLASEGYFGNQEEETSGATDFQEEDTTFLPDVVVVDKGSNEDTWALRILELWRKYTSGSGDFVTRSKRYINNQHHCHYGETSF